MTGPASSAPVAGYPHTPADAARIPIGDRPRQFLSMSSIGRTWLPENVVAPVEPSKVLAGSTSLTGEGI